MEIPNPEQNKDEIKDGTKELLEFLKKMTRKVTDLSNLQDMEEELMDIEFEGLKLHNDKEEDPFSNLLTIVHSLMPKNDDDLPFQLPKEKIEANKKQAEDLYQCLIEVELDCLKYNLPKLDRFDELDEYEEELRKYMKSWKDEAEMNREKGKKAFKELLQQIDQSSQEGFNTFEEVKLIVMSTGANLTRLLVDFLFLGSPTTENLVHRLLVVRTALPCLSVEDNSIFMDIVLDILKGAERKAMEENLIIQEKEKTSSSDEGDGTFYITSEEGDILRKILREFVRFEVSFCCPTLPIRYSNDFLKVMGEMFKTHSEEKMNQISSKIGELKKGEIATTGDTEDSKMNQLMLIFSSTSHIEAKWWDLELKPNA